MALIVSPLISLMEDQTLALQQRGVRAEFLCSTSDSRTIMGRAEAGEVQVLFMSPERVAVVPDSFWAATRQRGVCLIAVDEARAQHPPPLPACLPA